MSVAIFIGTTKKKLINKLIEEKLFSQTKQDFNWFYKLFLDKVTHFLDLHDPVTKFSIKEEKI